MEIKQNNCVDFKVPESGYLRTDEQPGENCINCILDDILSIKEGEARDFWISLYKEGKMMLNCAKTGKSYFINKVFLTQLNL